jgi:hypothetical protein
MNTECAPLLKLMKGELALPVPEHELPLQLESGPPTARVDIAQEAAAVGGGAPSPSPSSAAG